ncbi:hypothetical protein Ahy_B06g084550 [Arachis hypogaea]|uniref:Uncharacterized protein n=2 Tax=Arachis TaxID=3817 RepID=A0A444YS89_ARAHY|nr:hypothetical protein Ahy_B06g084550 [Arachis hypogaea]
MGIKMGMKQQEEYDGDGAAVVYSTQKMVFAYYVTGHEFGHATRVAEVVRHLILAGHDVHVVTAAPEFVFTNEKIVLLKKKEKALLSANFSLSLSHSLSFFRLAYSTMGDSETIVAEAPAAETHAAAGFGDSASNPTQEAASTVAEPAAEAATQANSAYALGYSNTGDGNAYAEDPNAMQPEAQTNSMEDSKQGTEAPSGLGSAATGSSQVNGGPVGAIANATGLENGNALGNREHCQNRQKVYKEKKEGKT